MFDCVLQKKKARTHLPRCAFSFEIPWIKWGRRGEEVWKASVFFLQVWNRAKQLLRHFFLSCSDHSSSYFAFLLPSISLLPLSSLLPFSFSSNNLLKQCFPLALQSTSFSSLFNSTAFTHFFLSTFWLPLCSSLSDLFFPYPAFMQLPFSFTSPSPILLAYILSFTSAP